MHYFHNEVLTTNSGGKTLIPILNHECLENIKQMIKFVFLSTFFKMFDTIKLQTVQSSLIFFR